MFNARQFCIVTKVCILTAFHSSSDKLSLEVVYDEFFWDRKWGIQKKKKKKVAQTVEHWLFSASG